MTIPIRHKHNLPSAGRKLLKHAGNARILAFYGEMGAGKTTIIKVLCRLLGAVDIAVSPTFTLVNEYRTASGTPIYHIDFYRINNTDEVFDFGFEEYLSGNNYCFIEWPGLVEAFLPEETLKIRIRIGENDERFLDLP